MALDENVLFVKSQLELYKTALAASNERLLEIVGRYRGIQRNLQDKQQELRSLRQELTRPEKSPSRAKIENLVRRQSFLNQLHSIDELTISLLDELREIAAGWAKATASLRQLPDDNLTSNDLQKVDELTRKICEQLTSYGFRSFQPSEIALSTDNFRPLVRERKGAEMVEKEINFEVSASDGIRLKWAYLISTIELQRTHSTNHPGLVIFDEPGQQEIDSVSLFTFLKRAAQSTRSGGQIIVSTSEPLPLVQHEMKDRAHIVDFPGFILQPQPNPVPEGFNDLIE